MQDLAKLCFMMICVGLISLFCVGMLLHWGYLDIKVGVQFEYENYTEEGEEDSICTEVGCHHDQYFLLGVERTEEIGYAMDEPLGEQVDFWLHDHDLL